MTDASKPNSVDADKQINRPKRPSAGSSVFALATRSSAVVAEVDIDDVRRFRPDLSPEQAQAFLGRHTRAIAEMMLAAALCVIHERLSEEAPDDDATRP